MDISSGTLNNEPQAPVTSFVENLSWASGHDPWHQEIEVILSTVVLLSEKLVCTDLCRESSHGSNVNNLKIIIGGQ